MSVENPRDFCLVVPRSRLIDSGFIPVDFGGYKYQRIFSDPSAIKRFYTLIEYAGEYRKKSEVEEDSSYQQITMYGFHIIVDDDWQVKFFTYERGGSDSSYRERRLQGKISVGIGGHMEPTDLSLEDSFYREFGEEAFIIHEGNLIDFQNEDGEVDIGGLKEYVEIIPFGFIKDDRDSVGRVHFGVLTGIRPLKEGVIIQVKEGENVQSMYSTIGELRKLTALGQINPESWTEIALLEEFKPNFLP